MASTTNSSIPTTAPMGLYQLFAVYGFVPPAPTETLRMRPGGVAPVGVEPEAGTRLPATQAAVAVVGDQVGHAATGPPGRACPSSAWDRARQC